MQKKFLICLAVFCTLWLILFCSTRLNEEFRQSLPLPLLTLVFNDDGISGGEWDENGAVERHLSTEHIIDVFRSDEIPHTDSEDEQEESEAEQDENDDDDDDIQLYDKNPRYTVEEDSKQGTILHTTIMDGDSMGKLLAEWMNANDYTTALNVTKRQYNVAKVKLGQPFDIILDPKTDEAKEFRYTINKNEVLIIHRDKKNFIAKVEQIPYDTELIRIHGAIHTSLDKAVRSMGESSRLTRYINKIFGSEINFITDFRHGDSFDILVEKRSRNGNFMGYGRILAARLINKGKTYQAYLFPNEKGKEMYYSEKGENLHRVLLKAPLSSLRVTSKYSMARVHPISGQVRPHQGVDYGAPYGTPIKSVGDGVITSIGRAGGYGNQIIIKHSGRLESMYGHMSRFAKGMREGVNVHQGQTIGYVGSTGIATGPHLDFRLKQRGNFVNPTKLVVPRDESVGSHKRMQRFKAMVNKVHGYWKGNNLSNYDADSWFAGVN